MMFPQAFCSFRDTDEMDRVMDGLILLPKPPEYLRLVCKESQETLSLIVLSFLRKEEIPLATRIPLQRFLYDHGSEREFVHLFSAKDDYGMLYHLRGIKETTVRFTVPFKVRPHAGGAACGHYNLNVEDFKRRLFDNPSVYSDYKAFERSSVLSDRFYAPTYMKKHVIFLDPTANQRGRYKQDAKVDYAFQENAIVPTEEEMSDIKKRLTKEIRKSMRQKQCAWAGCGKLDGNFVEFPHCIACERVSYCSKECQKKDWYFHKHVCKTGRLKKGLQSLDEVCSQTMSQ